MVETGRSMGCEATWVCGHAWADGHVLGGLTVGSRQYTLYKNS